MQSLSPVSTPSNVWLPKISLGTAARTTLLVGSLALIIFALKQHASRHPEMSAEQALKNQRIIRQHHLPVAVANAKKTLEELVKDEASSLETLADTLEKIWGSLRDYEREELSERQLTQLTEPLGPLSRWMAQQPAVDFHNAVATQTLSRIKTNWNAINETFSLGIPLELAPPTLSEQWVRMLGALDDGNYNGPEDIYAIIAHEIRQEAQKQERQMLDVLADIEAMADPDKTMVAELLILDPPP